MERPLLNLSEQTCNDVAAAIAAALPVHRLQAETARRHVLPIVRKAIEQIERDAKDMVAMAIAAFFGAGVVVGAGMASFVWMALS